METPANASLMRAFDGFAGVNELLTSGKAVWLGRRTGRPLAPCCALLARFARCSGRVVDANDKSRFLRFASVGMRVNDFVPDGNEKGRARRPFFFFYPISSEYQIEKENLPTLLRLDGL